MLFILLRKNVYPAQTKKGLRPCYAFWLFKREIAAAAVAVDLISNLVYLLCTQGLSLYTILYIPLGTIYTLEIVGSSKFWCSLNTVAVGIVHAVSHMLRRHDIYQPQYFCPK